MIQEYAWAFSQDIQDTISLISFEPSKVKPLLILQVQVIDHFVLFWPQAK